MNTSNPKTKNKIASALGAWTLILSLMILPGLALAQHSVGGGISNTVGGGSSNSVGGGSTNWVGGGSSGEGFFTNPIKAEDLSSLLQDILQVVIMLGAIVVVFFYILAGFKYVTARGDEKQISSATKTLTWTTVGAFIILGAQVIATAIEGTVSDLGL